MRELKFRAWYTGNSAFNKKMIYDEKPGDCLRWKHEGQDISDIMQYTGLKDKNGKEIYEGDIVIFYDSFSLNPYEVRWSKGRFDLHTEDNGYCNPNTEDIWIPYDMKIIGNIHNNPELLNEKP